MSVFLSVWSKYGVLWLVTRITLCLFGIAKYTDKQSYYLNDILPPVQYSTQRIPKIRNIQKQLYFIFSEKLYQISLHLIPAECHVHLLRLPLLKVDFLYKNSKNEHFNGKNIGRTAPFQHLNDFPLY